MTGRAVVAASIAVALLFTVPALGQEQSLPVAVVVAANAPMDSLSLGELRRIFLGDRQFTGDRTRITLIVPAPGTPERATVLRVLYRMREVEYRQYWVAKIFRAEVTGGPQVANAEQAKRQAAATRGAIALIPLSAVDRTVKVIVVSGRRPGQSGYELQ